MTLTIRNFIGEDISIFSVLCNYHPIAGHTLLFGGQNTNHRIVSLTIVVSNTLYCSVPWKLLQSLDSRKGVLVWKVAIPLKCVIICLIASKAEKKQNNPCDIGGRYEMPEAINA